MLDEELNAALKVHREVGQQYAKDRARHSAAPAPTSDELFLAAIGTGAGQRLLADIRALHGEARRVPDPGGPIGNYIDALMAWAGTHPEVDPSEMQRIINPLILSQA
jgi:hypothetical protein